MNLNITKILKNFIIFLFYFDFKNLDKVLVVYLKIILKVEKDLNIRKVKNVICIKNEVNLTVMFGGMVALIAINVKTNRVF